MYPRKGMSAVFLFLLLKDIRPLPSVVVIRIFLVHFVQLAVDFTFKGLDCVEPVLGNRAKFVALESKAIVGDGRDKHSQFRLVEEPGKSPNIIDDTGNEFLVIYRGFVIVAIGFIQLIIIADVEETTGDVVAAPV